MSERSATTEQTTPMQASDDVESSSSEERHSVRSLPVTPPQGVDSWQVKVRTMTMTSRERMLAAMDGKAVDVFPVVIPYLDIFLRDHWREVTAAPWWAVRDGNVATKLQVLRDMQAALEIDWIPTGAGASRRWRESHAVEERGGRVFLVNAETGLERELFEPPIGGEQVLVTTSQLHNEADVERVVSVPSAEEMLEGGAFDCAQAVIKEFGGTQFIVASVSAPYWGLYGCFGFYEMMTNLVERPALVECALERLTQQRLEYLKAYAAVGIDGVWLEDCYSSADLISLPHFRRFAAPGVKRVIDACRALGLKSIYYYCGDVSDRLEDLVQMQPDCLSLEESKKGFVIDIDEIDRLVRGRTCLFGNVDAIYLLETGSREDIAAEIQRQYAVGQRSGRFVLSLGSPVTPRTPTARVREFVELARRLGDFLSTNNKRINEWTVV